MAETKTDRRTFLAGAGLASLATLALPRVGSAQGAYPTKTIRIIVPFPPGGVADLMGRMAADMLSRALPQKAVVENKSGAGGNIGASDVARSEPDGHTLLLNTPGVAAINGYIYRNPGYDGVKDFAAVALMVKSPSLILVHPSLPVTTLTELIDYAKKNPGLRYGHTSIGGTKHLAGELLRLKAGIDIVPVAYRGGPPLLIDLVAGHIKVAFDDLMPAVPHIRSGSLRAIAITGPSRWHSLPNVPTVAELGGAFSGYDVTAWYGLLAPANTPAPIIARLNQIVMTGLHESALRDKLVNDGLEPQNNTPQQYQEYIVAEHSSWGEVIKAAKIPLN